jgi:hypothetical protein
MKKADSKRYHLTHPKLYSIWAAIRSRCNNPNVKGFRFYGGRGIRVCTQWKTPAVFCEWALKNGYKDGMKCYRKDIAGHFEPKNCYWSDKTINFRRVRLVTVNGETHTVTEWCEKLKISRAVIYGRLREGEDCAVQKIADIIAGKPLNHQRRYLTINGETLHLSAWAQKIKCCTNLIATWIFRYGEEVTKLRIQGYLSRKQPSRGLTVNGSENR